MPHRAEHPARARPTQELVGVGAAGDAAVVDLVSGSRDTRPLSGGQPKSLLGNEIRLDIEQTKTVDLGWGAFDAFRVTDDPTQHLEPAADAQQRFTCGRVLGHRPVQTTRPQPGEVGDRGSGAR